MPEDPPLPGETPSDHGEACGNRASRAHKPGFSREPRHPLSPSARAHRRGAPPRVAFARVTVSDSRTDRTDTGGALCDALLAGAGHEVLHTAIVTDDPAAIRKVLQLLAPRKDIDAILLTGGSGVGPRDGTPEVVGPLLEKELPGFGELFRMLSWEEVGPAAYLSRAMAGTWQGKAIFVLPGSPAAVRLAVERLILPEVGHLVQLLRAGA